MHPGPKLPSPWVTRFLSGTRAGGTMLDVACGSGRHLRHGLDQGLVVTGIDRDLSDAEDLGERGDVALIEADLETGRPFPLRDLRFDAVVVTHYLWRPILSDIVGCVADDGVFIYETFALGHHREGRPMRPDFLLKPNELLEVALPRLVVIAYEHGELPGDDAHGGHARVVQRIAACGPGHRWAGDTPFVFADDRPR